MTYKYEHLDSNGKTNRSTQWQKSPIRETGIAHFCTKVRNEYTANTITRFTKLCSFYRVLKRRIFPVWADWIRFTFLKVNSGGSQGSFRIVPSSGVWNSSDSGWNCPRTILRVTSRIGSNFEQSLGSTHCSPQRLSKEQKDWIIIRISSAENWKSIFWLKKS